MSETMTKAEIVESILHDSNFQMGEGADTWNLGRAVLFSICETEEGVSITEAGSEGDVYRLLEDSYSRQVAQVSDYIAIVTTGWAAPITDDMGDTPPSEHPERRRVRLLVFANRTNTASVMRFSDEPSEKISDDGAATGMLADAVRDLFA